MSTMQDCGVGLYRDALNGLGGVWLEMLLGGWFEGSLDVNDILVIVLRLRGTETDPDAKTTS